MDIHTARPRSHHQVEVREATTAAANSQIESNAAQLYSNQGTADKTTGDGTPAAGDNLKKMQKCMENDMVMKQYDADCESDHRRDSSTENLMAPLVLSGSSSPVNTSREIRSRKKAMGDDDNYDDNYDDDDVNANSNNNNSSWNNSSSTPSTSARNSQLHAICSRKKERLRQCCDQISELQRDIFRNTIIFMSFMARLVFWFSLVALSGAVFYYSRELYFHGTEAHLVAWFSAGAFVILGFPISIYGILMHLANYYQPNIQCYVVRILWMVPIYSIESWLCLRFHEFAIYIETLRDVYESFVLYCFLQFLIEVLGGEEALILLLKDKSPTRGFHYAPMNWCLKPWIMGQPVSRTGGKEARGAETTTSSFAGGERTVRWTSPFFVQCKFGCLQYVLLKFVTSIAVCWLEVYGLYKEGDWTTRGGYLYIIILTNLSQCWALYCLVFFYYATKNELSPIRPVGKFLSVKMLVFFTWWQSLGITILVQLELIPSYDRDNMTPEDVAKGLQAYLICIEMFIGAIVHMFVFPHTDYLKPITVTKPAGSTVFARSRRLGRHGVRNWNDDRSMGSKKSGAPVVNLEYLESQHNEPEHIEITGGTRTALSPSSSISGCDENPDLRAGIATKVSAEELQQKTRFSRALIDSFVPRDVMDNTVGIARGDFTVEKKTLLYHAAASDQYSLFAKRKAMQD